MKYLKRFNENLENNYDFNESNYDAINKSIIGAYMIIDESDKSIELLNLFELEDKKSSFADNHIPYTIKINRVKLPKSQIEILDEVIDKPGFNWVRIPYWLFKSNKDLKIQRMKSLKRFSNMTKIHSNLNPKDIDENVIKYLRTTDKDNRTHINLENFIKKNN
jgi:hypothetical protein